MAPAVQPGLMGSRGVPGHVGRAGARVPDAAVHASPCGAVVSCRVYVLHGLRPPLGASALARLGAGAAGCVAAWLALPPQGAQSLHPIFHSGCRSCAHLSGAAKCGSRQQPWGGRAQELLLDRCWPLAPTRSLQ